MDNLNPQKRAWMTHAVHNVEPDYQRRMHGVGNRHGGVMTRTDRKEMDASSPLRSIRAMCLECIVYVSDEVKGCTIPDCPLYPFRLGRSVKGKSRLKAINQHCRECMGGSLSMVKDCHSGPRLADDEPGCPVHEYRAGHNPKLKGKRRATPKAIEALRRFRSQARDVRKRPPESTIST